MTLRVTTRPDLFNTTGDGNVRPITPEDHTRYRRLYDLLRDDRMFIEVDELENLLVGKSLHNTREELTSIINEMELEFSSHIDYDEFAKIIHRLTATQELRAHPSFFLGHGKTLADLANSETRREILWRNLEDPTYSMFARVVSVLIMATIFVSSANFIVESIPEVGRHDDIKPVFLAVEWVCVIIFSVEYITRLLVCPDKCAFMKSVMNGIDLVAIVPFYVELAVNVGGVGSTQFLRTLRLIRVFRIFKISRYISWLQLIIDACVSSLAPLGMALFITLIYIVVLGSAMWYIERGSYDRAARRYMHNDDIASDFQSITDGMWWCVITMTTVGYGDVHTRTPLGKVLASFTCWCGIVLLAIPISVFSANFARQYNKMVRKRKLQKEQDLDICLQVESAVPRHLRAIRSFASKRFYQSFDNVGGCSKPPLIRAQEFEHFDLSTRANLQSAMTTIIESARKRLWWEVREHEVQRRQAIARQFGESLGRWFGGDGDKLSKLAKTELSRQVTSVLKQKAMGVAAFTFMKKANAGVGRGKPGIAAIAARVSPPRRVVPKQAAHQLSKRRFQPASPDQVAAVSRRQLAPLAGSSKLRLPPLSESGSPAAPVRTAAWGSSPALRSVSEAPSGGASALVGVGESKAASPGSRYAAAKPDLAEPSLSPRGTATGAAPLGRQGSNALQLTSMKTMMAEADAKSGNALVASPLRARSSRATLLAPLSSVPTSVAGRASALPAVGEVDPNTLTQTTETITNTTHTTQDGVTVTHSSIVRVTRTRKPPEGGAAGLEGGAGSGALPEAGEGGVAMPVDGGSAAVGAGLAAGVGVGAGVSVEGGGSATGSGPPSLATGQSAKSLLQLGGETDKLASGVGVAGSAELGPGTPTNQQVRESTFEH